MPLLDLEATLFLSIRVLVLECESSMGSTTIAALIALFAIAITLDAAQLALLAVCSSALCGYGYMDMKGDDE